MDPCHFVKLTVGKLGLKFPVSSKPARSVIHPSSSPCFCKIKLKNFPEITSPVPCIETDSQLNSKAASFHLNKLDLEKLAGKSKKVSVRIEVYTGGRSTSCGLSSGRLLGRVSVQVDLSGTESKACVFHNGWVSIGKDEKCGAMFHLNLKAEPDPRFVFEFDGEPECSPQVFQIKGNVRQPVFTCKFSFRSTGGNQRTRLGFGIFGIVLFLNFSLNCSSSFFCIYIIFVELELCEFKFVEIHVNFGFKLFE